MFDLFYRLTIDGGADSRAAAVRHLRDLNLIGRGLELLHDSSLAPGARDALWTLIARLLHNNPRPVDLLL